MLKGLKYRIYPSISQKEQLAKEFGCSRWAYNYMLALTQKEYQEKGKGLTYYGMAMLLPALKKENEWLKEVHSQPLQQSLRHLSVAFSNFFNKKSRYPVFKKKHGKQSIHYPQGFKVGDGQMIIPKLGNVRAVFHRPLKGAPCSITLSLTPCGHYYASVLVEDGKKEKTLSAKGKAIGIDMGLEYFLTTSDGEQIANPRHLNKYRAILKRRQQSLSRKVKGSNGRAKARTKVARIHERIKNTRTDFLQKLSTRVVHENQVIAVESLQIRNMVKNHKLARAISDAGWRTFLTLMEYKAKREGKVFVKVGRWYPSSKICSSCGMLQEKMPLNIRDWKCNGCGVTHNRDINASVNIRAEGLRALSVGMTDTAGGARISRPMQFCVGASGYEAGSLAGLSPR